MSPHLLPSVDAVLNATSACLLAAGWWLVRHGRREAHRRAMLAAVASSTAFLVCYVVYHARVGSVPFARPGAVRAVYFTLLLSHTVLAAAIVPLVLLTLSRALRARYDAHRGIARVTAPLWLWVSVSGVAVYWMLYRI